MLGSFRGSWMPAAWGRVMRTGASIAYGPLVQIQPTQQPTRDSSVAVGSGDGYTADLQAAPTGQHDGGVLTNLQHRFFHDRRVPYPTCSLLYPRLAEGYLTESICGQILGRVERVAWRPTWSREQYT